MYVYFEANFKNIYKELCSIDLINIVNKLRMTFLKKLHCLGSFLTKIRSFLDTQDEVVITKN